jgi:glutamate dehydrogenase (NADP+)
VTLAGMRVAVQGFGNAGVEIARLLQEAGARVVAVSDSRGGVHREDGFDVASLARAKRETRRLGAVYCEGSVCAQVDHDGIGNDELLALDVDLLVPAALGGVIGAGNARDVRARVVLEVANGPIDSAADPILAERGITVLPDVLANAGGVVVSYFEWVQNRQGMPWPLARVRGRLAEYMTGAFERVWAIVDQGRTPREAAYTVALRRIADALRHHGTHAYFMGRDE